MDCSNTVDELQSQKEKLMPEIITTLGSNCEMKEKVENIKLATTFLPSCEITEVDKELLVHIMPALTEAIQNMCSENCNILSTSSIGYFDVLHSNLQMCLALIEISNQILTHITHQQEAVDYSNVESVPLNLAQTVLTIFQHCKTSQKLYESNFDALIIELFKNTQETHLKFLKLIDVSLAYDFLCEEEVFGLIKDLLKLMLKISQTLVGMNTKSMVENWKGFVAVARKHSDVLMENSFNWSLPIRVLTEEVHNILLTMHNMASSDTSKAKQMLKIAGFLIKILLKLFETYWMVLENFYDEVLFFCLVMCSFPAKSFTLQSNKVPEEFLLILNESLTDPLEAFLEQILDEDNFLKIITTLNEENYMRVAPLDFGFLQFSYKVLKVLPNLVNSGRLRNYNVVKLLDLIFISTTKVYGAFITDESDFHAELVRHIAVIVLIFPERYSEIEEILLKSVVQDNIFTAMLAADVWILILRNCTPSTSLDTITALLQKLRDLNLGIIFQPPAVIHLKILINRIFKIYPKKSELVSRYSLDTNLAVWKILDAQLIPVTQRDCIEKILGDLYNKVDSETISLNDYIFIAETLEIVSSVNFMGLYMKTTRLAQLVLHFWHFNTSICAASHFFKYFMRKLCKITKALIHNFTGENLILILGKIKELTNEPTLKIHFCEVVLSISKTKFENISGQNVIASLLIEIFHTLLTDRSPVVVQSSLGVLQVFMDNGIVCSEVYKKVLKSSGTIQKLAVRYATRKVEVEKSEYFEVLCNASFKHTCYQWSSGSQICESTAPKQPQSKRMKINDESDDIICRLKSDAGRLQELTRRSALRPEQVSDLKILIDNLQALC